MQWWGMVETLAELFARHSSTDKFDGNLKGPFRASIGEEEYGVDNCSNIGTVSTNLSGQDLQMEFLLLTNLRSCPKWQSWLMI